MKIIKILGIPFAHLTQAEAVEKLANFLDEPKNHIIVTPNPEGVMQARRNPAFRKALKNADLSLADGTGILIASFLLRRRAPQATPAEHQSSVRVPSKPVNASRAESRLPERVRGVDTAFALFEKISLGEKERTAYFLGGAPGVAETAKKTVEARFPKIKVTGCHHGFFSDAEERQILNEINTLAPDILLVCTGMPRAEIWATKHKNLNTRLTMCLGGTIDILAGTAKLAPPLMRKLGLEWLHRLLRNPSRAKRMLDLPRFILAVLFRK